VRTVEPYGLVFLTGHWYLVAFDPTANGMRQFRVSRIRDAAMGTRPQHPDFEVPTTFDLAAHASSRRAWELGNGEQERIVVAFRGDSGLVAQGRQLGDDVEGPLEDVAALPTADSALRLFQVRRRDPFLRWLLSFAGDARPVAPAHVVTAWRALLTATRAAQLAAPLATPAAPNASTTSTSEVA
jgi:predicted DNA-binding transcriptional regulator YafY